ncbi:MAG: TetR/AcrR family transcriptional regulator [Actinomycetota bacterium]
MITREMIAEAVLAIGFDSLTMTKVADRLGVSHAALYSHVADRDDLVVAAADRAVTQMSVPDPADDWRNYLRAIAHALYEMELNNPGLNAALEDSDGVSEVLRVRLAEVHGELVNLGFDASAAFMALELVAVIASDSADRSTRLLRRSQRSRVELGEAWSEGYDDELRTLMIAATTTEPTEWFTNKLEVVLDGVGTSLAPKG